MSSKRAPLTKTKIEKTAVSPGARQVMLWDSVVVGLAVRCLPGGSKTFVFRYRPHGGGRSVNPRVLRLGAFPSISLDDARSASRIHAGSVARGLDPAQERAEVRRRDRATLGKLLSEGGAYEMHLKTRGVVNLKPALSSLRRGLKAHMASDVATLDRNDIVTAIDALTKLGLPGAAADLRRHSRSFFEWAVARGFAKFNPLAGLREPSRTRHHRLQAAEPRGRALSDAEVVKIWRAAQTLQDRGERGSVFGGLVQLGLLTAMRRSELAQLQYRHILTNEDATIDDHGIIGARISLLASVTKTGSSHSVPLTALMRKVIGQQPRTTSALMFPTRTGTRIRSWTKPTTMLRDLSGIDVRLHDLRRTCRTLMSRLGISEDIAELAIGHQRADLVARYNKDQAWPARVEAFEKVSARISALLAAAADTSDTSNVIAMHGRDQRPTG
ncbi:MAG TPA: integrase arm-type DNA-binding domain-containing protein [Xanthobacteraceae bacterium]|jgi:integrase